MARNVVAIEGKGPLRGDLTVPGDKSISHRAVMFGALAQSQTRISNFLPGQDCLSTISCFQKLGVPIVQPSTTDVIVEGQGLMGLKEPSDLLDVGNSGTTMRLMAGILSGQSFFSVMTGDSSIRRRPMGRVTEPLKAMGSTILGREGGKKAPLAIAGTQKPLLALTYQSPVASAQVKSAILLAGLYAEGSTKVIEPHRSRDHSERMLKAFGAKISQSEEGLNSEIEGFPSLIGQEIDVPGDISSAAFLLVAASVIPGSELYIRNVGINPTRDGVIEVLRAMGGKIKVENERVVAGEPVADILVQASTLHGTTIEGEVIPRLIDEIPILAVAALFAQGQTTIKDAEELRVKESDRIAVLADQLRMMGAKVKELPDGMIIEGSQTLQGAEVESKGDHRIAMALAVAGLLAEGVTEISDASAVEVSYPGFFSVLTDLQQ
ncbi:3-phosphoshikimate 1-carboxyvinyltransferase [Heliorestis acidaminivorans]|uniref:3-phosphoshikimate 1-carboxyvinyltransferase n=1 Tax=Heliorestis acidaminivorans TaxID=553427 RepID=A0A6I0FAX4_9FIRM|nr:3-phosphoshikimate 1-carboxyvinyltransferase [Heliorestis acidaminivorans]KAB2954628.1 3-phosphoshikimate 1-carboxyvinyltransferase [Heliorestis acidaminivorans]